MEMDFIVDKADEDGLDNQRICVPSFHWFGTHIPNRNFLTSGGRQNLGIKNKGHGLQSRRPEILCNGKPEGEERWAVQKYTSITPKTNFKLFNAFADEDENPELPGSDWDLNFSEQDGTTKVSISIYNESLERLERMIEMGFNEGTKMQLKNLKELLAKLSRAKETKQ